MTGARVEELAKGVHAYVQPDGGWCVSNSGIITGRDSVTVIDTAATEARARSLAAAAAEVGGRAPRTLVNTHHHGDHTFGNFVFAPAATVVAHERARAEMAEKGLGLKHVWPDTDWGAIEVVLPSVTFSEELTLHVDDLVVELVHVGPAHTTNDVVAWLPAERILFAGDVVLSGCTPFALMGSVRGSLRALDTLEAWEPETVVCGHGPVCGPEVFAATRAYFHWLGDVAAEGFAAGTPPLEQARRTDLGGFAGLLDRERLVANLHRAYAELAGAADGDHIPSGPVFAEMVAYNGGRPLSCSA
ncbi:MBL fold metallo-hydrolase [Amycolatopsis sp. lyj-23]|uniref:MBL fold metallo-hydrolase n=1 Tax=Amycolatopsis sp. lyj-23 TaxID=2789283 RepID=UPI00397E6361